MQKLVLLDFEDRQVETPVDLEDLENIKEIEIRVITGDEIAVVLYNSGYMKSYDSGRGRIEDFFDGSYMLYHCGVFVTDINKFLNRKNSYEIFHIWEENND